MYFQQTSLKTYKLARPFQGPNLVAKRQWDASEEN